MQGISIFSFVSFGYEGTLVKVETDIKNGLPQTDIVGLAGNAIKESKERIRVAIKNSNLEFPAKRILINLSPASEKKEGSSFDLPIALSILLNSLQHTGKNLPILVMGELELSGAVLPVQGVLAAMFSSLQKGISTFIVPEQNTYKAYIPEYCKVFGVKNLYEAFSVLCNLSFEDNDGLKPYEKRESSSVREKSTVVTSAFGGETGNFTENEPLKPFFIKGKPFCPKLTQITWSETNAEMDYCEVKGQTELISALELAAAGGHNVIAYGPPGCGKSLSLSRFSELLPDLDLATSRELSRIYSIAGLLPPINDDGSSLIKRPPFRVPHQSASLEGIIGGAGKCLPGEISLSHGGALFLDETNQFKTTVLQSLRAPLETGYVTLSRAEKRTTFPASFQALLALNPCPCGNSGSPDKFCTCSPQSIDHFWKKLTAPLLDRIDLRVFVLPPTPKEILESGNHSTKALRERIKNALEVQYDRNFFFSCTEVKSVQKLKNSFLHNENLLKICNLSDEARRAFTSLESLKESSGRTNKAILKVARTISDLEGESKITVAALEKAVHFRMFKPFLPDFVT